MHKHKKTTGSAGGGGVGGLLCAGVGVGVAPVDGGPCWFSKTALLRRLSAAAWRKDSSRSMASCLLAVVNLSEPDLNPDITEQFRYAASGLTQWDFFLFFPGTTRCRPRLLCEL